MKAVSLGGTSLFPTSEIINIKSLNNVIGAGGLGEFSTVELQKVLAGKKASASAQVGDKTEAISGNCSPKDFETMLQLTYLAFTAPRKDVDAFESYKNRTKASLLNQEMNPMITFVDSIQGGIYMNHPRMQRIKADMIDKIDYDRILAMYKDRFKDASDFTFILVGNVDIEAAKPLIAQYIASLPSIKRKETFKDNKVEMRKGIYKNEFIKEQETAKASVFAFYNGACKYDLKNNLLISMTDQILDLVYTEKVREEEGGTYGVNVGGDLQKYPQEKFVLQIMFDTAPAKKEKLIGIIFGELENLGKNGPSEVNLNKVKEFMLKKYKEDLKENGFWLSTIDDYLFTNVDMTKDYEAILNSITAKDIQNFATSIFSQKNEVEVTMISPEKK
jgi:zinc protease